MYDLLSFCILIMLAFFPRFLLFTANLCVMSCANIFSDNENSNFWVGLNDKEVESVFRWVNGEPLKYNAWDANGQPRGRTEQNCVILDKDSERNFQDKSCYEHFLFVCSSLGESFHKSIQ